MFTAPDALVSRMSTDNNPICRFDYDGVRGHVRDPRKGQPVAEKVILIDDLDESEGSDVVRREFRLLDRTFAIDLADGNHKRLEDALGFIEIVLDKSREVKQAGRARRPAQIPQRLQGYTNTDVREWAREQSLEVSERGKIADDIVEKFIDAHPVAKQED
jgi:hypothetical protein